MEQIVLNGELLNISISKIHELLIKHFDNKLIRFLENGTVIDYEDNSVEFNIEPQEEGDITKNENIDFHLTAIFTYSKEKFDVFISEFNNSLKEKGIFFSIDYQNELEDGTLLGDERNISHLPNK